MSCMTNRLNNQESKYTPEDLFCLIIVTHFHTLQILPENVSSVHRWNQRTSGLWRRLFLSRLGWNCPFRIPSASFWCPNIYRKCGTLWIPLIQPQKAANKQQILASSSTQKKADRKIETATALTESGNKLTALGGGGSGSLVSTLNKAQEEWKEVPHPWFQCFSFPALCFRFTGQNTLRVSK